MNKPGLQATLNKLGVPIRWRTKLTLRLAKDTGPELLKLLRYVIQVHSYQWPISKFLTIPVGLFTYTGRTAEMRRIQSVNYLRDIKYFLCYNTCIAYRT